MSFISGWTGSFSCSVCVQDLEICKVLIKMNFCCCMVLIFLSVYRFYGHHIMNMDIRGLLFSRRTGRHVEEDHHAVVRETLTRGSFSVCVENHLI